MRKRDELIFADSCLNRARSDELVFVLLGRDAAAPAAIRSWVAERLRLGLNQPFDPQIREAEHCACTMEAELRAEQFRRDEQAGALPARLITYTADGPCASEGWITREGHRLVFLQREQP